MGRGRLVTMQAIAENGEVLVGLKAAVAALKMVNNVFNFFLSCLNERQMKIIQLVFMFPQN